MRKWALINQGKLLKVKSEILPNWLEEKYESWLEEFTNMTRRSGMNGLIFIICEIVT